MKKKKQQMTKEWREKSREADGVVDEGANGSGGSKMGEHAAHGEYVCQRAEQEGRGEDCGDRCDGGGSVAKDAEQRREESFGTAGVATHGACDPDFAEPPRASGALKLVLCREPQPGSATRAR